MYGAQVFYAGPSFCHAVGHEVIPHVAGAHAHQHALVGLLHHLEGAHGRVHHYSLVVVFEEQVAATADMDESLATGKVVGEQERLQLLHRIVFKEQLCAHIHPEGVVCQ